MEVLKKISLFLIALAILASCSKMAPLDQYDCDGEETMILKGGDLDDVPGDGDDDDNG
jgi:hypothetical protein